MPREFADCDPHISPLKQKVIDYLNDREWPYLVKRQPFLQRYLRRFKINTRTKNTIGTLVCAAFLLSNTADQITAPSSTLIPEVRTPEPSIPLIDYRAQVFGEDPDPPIMQFLKGTPQPIQQR